MEYIHEVTKRGPFVDRKENNFPVVTCLQRIIRCGGAVDDDMANLIVAQLLYLDAADPNRVCVMISSSHCWCSLGCQAVCWICS